MGKNLKSLGQWFKHEECVLRERVQSRHAWVQGLLPAAPWPFAPGMALQPKGSSGAITPWGLFQGCVQSRGG